MVIAADQHNRLPRINHFCDIPEILFGRSRLVFQDHLFILYTALRQNIMHDSRLCLSGLVRIPASQNQLRFGIFIQISLGCIQSCDQVICWFSVFQCKSQHDCMFSRARGVDQTAADHFPAEKQNHHRQGSNDAAQPPSNNPYNPVFHAGEQTETNIKGKQEENRTHHELVLKHIPGLRFLHNRIHFVNHYAGNINREQNHQNKQNIPDDPSDLRNTFSRYHIHSSGNNRISRSEYNTFIRFSKGPLYSVRRVFLPTAAQQQIVTSGPLLSGPGKTHCFAPEEPVPKGISNFFSKKLAHSGERQYTMHAFPIGIV